MADLSPRQSRILALLSAGSEAQPAALAARFGVSVQTIRSDLRALSEAGEIRRRHGRVTLQERALPADPGAAEKARIGAEVAQLIPEGARLALGTGTTVAACARALRAHRGLQIFTNNLQVVLALAQAPEVQITLAGGPVRLHNLDLIGAETMEFFARIRADFAIFSVGGISPAGDLLEFTMDEIRARRALCDTAPVRMLVADSAKFSRLLPHADGRINRPEMVVAGAQMPPLLAEDCRAGGNLVRLV